MSEPFRRKFQSCPWGTQRRSGAKPRLASTRMDSDQWPPPGHAFTYVMTVDLENPKLQYTAEVSVPGERGAGGVDLATMRWDRLGGPSPADVAFRSRLYEAIGAVTVAGGHVEAAMKRVILTAEKREEQFADVDLTWTDLSRRLERIVGDDGDFAAALGELLQWASTSEVKKRRDDVVHAYWWNLDGVGVTRSRFTRRGESYQLMSSLEQLEEDATHLFTLARRLDDLVLGQWPQARLLSEDLG